MRDGRSWVGEAQPAGKACAEAVCAVSPLCPLLLLPAGLHSKNTQGAGKAQELQVQGQGGCAWVMGCMQGAGACGAARLRHCFTV